LGIWSALPPMADIDVSQESQSGQLAEVAPTCEEAIFRMDAR